MLPKTLAGLSLRDLEYAVAIADLGQFGRAAEHWGVSQAGLSEQVQRLEAQLEVALFERTTRQMAVTSDGKALLRQAREVRPAGRPLRLGVIATLGTYYVPGLLQEVRRRYPLAR